MYHEISWMKRPSQYFFFLSNVYTTCCLSTLENTKFVPFYDRKIVLLAKKLLCMQTYQLLFGRDQIHFNQTYFKIIQNINVLSQITRCSYYGYFHIKKYIKGNKYFYFPLKILHWFFCTALSIYDLQLVIGTRPKIHFS